MKEETKQIEHFGVFIDSRKKYLKINRDEYAEIDRKNHSLSVSKKEYNLMEEYRSSDVISKQKIAKSYFENYLKVFEDNSLTTFNNNYCIEHQKNCLINYDLNMNFFSKINYNDFEKMITSLKKKFKKLIEIQDLSIYDKKPGIYILVLDEYKQVYVGQTRDIKKRILQHWTNRKEFFKLIFGDVETSVLSIDSFGALDTTRILIYQIGDLFLQLDLEDKITKFIPKEYLLNRTKGGDRGFLNDEIKINTIGTMNRRNLV